jgi:DNA polymerase III subunit gamma/tau
MSMALYRKYRSKSLDEIVGQSHVTDILARSLAQGIIAHAYLLTGPRGVGKTSIARILAHEINKLPYNEDTPHLDIIEIDAASNNGVEDVRELREKVQIAPVSASKKIYIIDEVHMLSKAAFNALLKTLEEPPEHAVFILATTDSDKLPATIISRTQRFHFRTISVADAVKHLKYIAEQEKIKIDDDALELIAIRGDGSFRDSISLFDQLRSIADKKTGITRQLAEQALGLAPAELVTKLLAAYEAKDLATLVELIDESENSGIQPTVLASQLLQTVRHEIVTKPQLIPLLDQLLDVAKSPRPNIKLLTTLSAHATPKPKTAALAAPTAEISAPIAELEKQATKSKPVMQSKQLIDSDSQKPSRSTTLTQDNLQPEADQTPGLLSDPERSLVLGEGGRRGEQKKTKTPPATDFNWQKLIDNARQHHVAVYSVLSKCGYELDGTTLVLYTKNAFYKKKLDDSKHRINLQKSLTEIGAGDLVIETVPTPAPPKDSQAAAVAAIMGGGEEVSVDE